MSEDTVTFIFKNDAKSPKINTVIKKITAAYHKTDAEVDEVSGGKHEDGYFVSLWPECDDDLGGMTNALAYLMTLSSEALPYATLSLDQTGDSFFYVLVDGNLHGFEDEQELAQHLTPNSEPSLEKSFYDAVDDKQTLLFVRMKCSSVKPIKALEKACTEFIEARDDESYSKLKSLIDHENEHGFVDFPLTDIFRDKTFREGDVDPIATSSMGDLDLARGLVFCTRNKSQLYLGFAYDKKFGIAPCEEGDEAFWARNNMMNGEGRQVLELLESLMSYPSDTDHYVSRLQAKFQSPLEGMSGHFFNLPDADGTPEYKPRWDDEELPMELWPS